jgi:O-acetyl-ADP-ribose deacetylase (regulator of RNase III)
MKLIIVDVWADFCKAAEKYFDGLPDVAIVNDRFENLADYDCMVSAANSFGLMDGGVDGAITAFFGKQLMSTVQEHILMEFLGEQPVGSSIIVGTGHDDFPYIAHTPTMRVPMDIGHTDNVYMAMLAMLRAVHQHNEIAGRKIKVIACPGLGTGVGKMPAAEAARQMALAYKNFLKPPFSIDWDYASQRQADVRYGGYAGFKFPMEEE